MGHRLAFVALIALVALLPTGSADAAPPSTRATAAVVIDLEDGKILLEKSGSQRLPVASTTKVVTALVVLSAVTMDEVVRISPRAEQVGESDALVSELELKAGEEWTVGDLMYGMMLHSANDAAIALAEHTSGSVDAFVSEMNQLARKLGAQNSSFTNPTGLDEPGHLSTALDLALLAREGMSMEPFRRIVGASKHQISSPRPMVVVNRNRSLETFPGADGVKTGQTRLAGRCLVMSATRSGERRLAVVLNSPDPLSESSALLEHSYRDYERVEVASRREAVGFVTLGDGSTYTLTARADLRVLIPADGPAPELQIDPSSRWASTKSEPTNRVQLDRRCVSRCGSAQTDGPLVWLLEVLEPVADPLASLFV